MSITSTEAYEAMLAHHRKLGEELAGRADAVSAAVTAGEPYGIPVASVIAYLADEVLPHAAAEEKAIYPAAAARADLAGIVGEMVAEHVTLSAMGARLPVLTDGAAAAEQARKITALFTAHAARENDVLLPALLADRSVDLGALLERMHAAAAGEDPLLDVRDLAPAQRHETIFRAYHDLTPGTGFVLVNDHDPKPLGYQFEAEYAGQFTWDYLESGPEVWRVRIGRPAAGA